VSPDGRAAALASDSLPATEVPVIRIEASRGWVKLGLGELWDYRELLYFLIWRDIKVRYKQTVLGAAWAIIQPFMSMVVFTLFFGRLARIPSDGVPYPIFNYSAMVAWTFFANGLTQASNSLVGSSNLLKKIYFPRLVIPIASILAGLVDFALAFTVLVPMMLYFGIVPSPNVVWLPFFLLLAFSTALGVGLWLSALNVQFRDVRHTVGFIVQFWLFASPVVYSSNLIENDLLRTLYGINPMASVVEGFRWALLGSASDQFKGPGAMLIVSCAAALLMLVSGLYYFRRMEKTFADVA
jgi:lipopolysaccharide transport system permease protein